MITTCQNGTQFVQERSPSKKIKAVKSGKSTLQNTDLWAKTAFFLIFSVIGLGWGGRGVGE